MRPRAAAHGPPRRRSRTGSSAAASPPPTPSSVAERAWPSSVQYTVPPCIARSRASSPDSDLARRPGGLTITPAPGAITASVPSRASRSGGTPSQQARFMNETDRRLTRSTTETFADGPPSPSLWS